MSRHERKQIRNASFALREKLEREARERQQRERNQWAQLHPVSAGLIPLVEYVPPR